MQRELPGIVVPNVGRDIDVAAHLFFHAAFFIAIGAFGGGRKDVQKSDHQPTGAFLHTDYARHAVNVAIVVYFLWNEADFRHPA